MSVSRWYGYQEARSASRLGLACASLPFILGWLGLALEHCRTGTTAGAVEITASGMTLLGVLGSAFLLVQPVPGKQHPSEQEEIEWMVSDYQSEVDRNWLQTCLDLANVDPQLSPAKRENKKYRELLNRCVAKALADEASEACESFDHSKADCKLPTLWRRFAAMNDVPSDARTRLAALASGEPPPARHK